MYCIIIVYYLTEIIKSIIVFWYNVHNTGNVCMEETPQIEIGLLINKVCSVVCSQYRASQTHFKLSIGTMDAERSGAKQIWKTL